MKKYLNSILSMAALLMASATVFTACSNDDDIIGEQPAASSQQTYTMTINASKGGDATTRALSLDGKALNATWAEGDKVKVYNSSNAEIGELTAETSGASTKLKGDLITLPTDGETLTLKFLSPSYASQNGTIEHIAANCDYATATVTATVSGSAVTATDANFENKQAIVKFTLIDKADGTTPLSATKLVINDGTTDYTINPASETSEIYAAIPGFTGQTVRLTATVGNNTYTYEKASVSFTNGQYYEITVKMTEVLKPDLLSGVFSVSGSKKVKFSKGNLRYASGAWSFFNNQYNYYTSYSADAWDHFGWSTSATTYGMNTSTDKSTYSGSFVDWGSNSDLQTALGTGWFTLSSAESTYLFNTRSASTVGGTSNGRYAKAKVNNVQGVILFPDTYTHPDGVTAPKGVNATDATGWDGNNGNNYSSADWTKMESAGCVFLPGAGYRDGESLVSTGIFGAYWSATSSGKVSDYSAYDFVYYYAGWLAPAFTNTRNLGFCVRLVRQVE